MVIHDEFKSLPCPTIHYTCNEILERWSWCGLPESVQPHSILVWTVHIGKAKFYPPTTQKSGCDDQFRAHTPISALSNHSSYYWWDIGRVELMWNAWINPNTLHLGLKCKGPWAENVPTRDSKVRVWWWLYMMNSNLYPVQPFNIHVMRYWKGRAGVNCLNQSNVTQSWCEQCV